ncbi:acyl-CoA thioesterase [Sphingopyxis sp. PET50]|uniref:acyl-CoA thioesterase n=1 Tax=Sphingopyxis sp. PET50 TaxID=2976533 RepID=UPI0021B05A69|nr:thioesterase family protein [Sphingopyxis sp. PET50]
MTAPLSALLELGAGSDGCAFAAAVPERLCVGQADRRFLFGGIALAACIEAMERRTALPAIFASVQFIAAAHGGDALLFETDVAAGGRSVRQCGLTARREGEIFLQGHGACGRREGDRGYPEPCVPRVPPPGQCPERSVARLLSSNMQALLEFRLAAGELPDRAGWTGEGGAELACWVRPRDGSPIDRRLLAVIADCAALALPGALGRPASGSSLDNMIRFLAEPDGDWVLAMMRVEGIGDGFAHVGTRICSPAGVPLALASQSMALRLWDGG